jgi:hypothetical protein
MPTRGRLPGSARPAAAPGAGRPRSRGTFGARSRLLVLACGAGGAWQCTEAPAPRPASAAQTAPQAVAWSTPVVLMRGPDALFRIPVVAAADSVAYVITGPPAEAIPSRAPAGDRDRIPFRGVRVGDAAPIPPPPGNFAFVFPRAEMGADGALHVVWAEPADGTRPAPGQDLRLLKVTSLWHAVYHRGAWSAPRRIWEGAGVDWQPERGSSLVADRAGGLNLAFSGEDRGGRWTLTYLRWLRGSWVRSEVGSVAPAGYTDLAVAPGGEVAIVYAAAHADSGRSHVNALFLTRSTDQGRNWSDHRVIGGPGHWPAYEPRVLIDRGNVVHVTWQRHRAGSSRTGAFWHAATRDGGISWSGYDSLAADGVFSGTQAAMDHAGQIHLVLTAFQNARPELYYAAFGREGWTGPVSLFPGRMSLQPSLRITAGNHLHLAWIAQPPGVALSTRPSPADTVPWFEVAYSTARTGTSSSSP